MNHPRSLILISLLTISAGMLPAAWGQPTSPVKPAPTPAQSTPSDNRSVDDDAPEWMKKLSIDPKSDTARKYAEQAKKRKSIDKELRKIRGTYFLTRHAKKRQEGIAKLWEYKDPAYFPALAKTFEREDTDVRVALLDLFADSKSDGGDATLTWMAVFDRDASIRKEAINRVRSRMKELGEAPLPTKLVIYEGLASRDQTNVSAAAGAAKELQLIEAIPWLINAQIQAVSTGGASSGSGTGALAWIAIGTQTAYVSGLRPVVSQGAVAFDPQISVDNSGVVVRIQDAVAIQYNFDVYNSLVDITSNAWDQPTKSLGFNIPKWQKWYAETFTPYWAKKQAAIAAEKRRLAEEVKEKEAEQDSGKDPAANTPKPGGG